MTLRSVITILNSSDGDKGANVNSEYRRYLELVDRRERASRLFQPLHQNDDPAFRRASGSSFCEHCGLQYRDHGLDYERVYFSDAYDRRLCNGDIVHL